MLLRALEQKLGEIQGNHIKSRGALKRLFLCPVEIFESVLMLIAFAIERNSYSGCKLSLYLSALASSATSEQCSCRGSTASSVESTGSLSEAKGEDSERAKFTDMRYNQLLTKNDRRDRFRKNSLNVLSTC